MSIKLLVHQRKDPLKSALYVITFYYGLTAGILALFITISGGHGIPTPEDMGAGTACGIVLGVFFGVWLFSAIFFLPYYYRKLIKEDRRLRIWHIPMGPLLWREGYNLYYPGDPNSQVVPNYYESEYQGKDTDSLDDNDSTEKPVARQKTSDEIMPKDSNGEDELTSSTNRKHNKAQKKTHADLAAIDKLPWYHPSRLWATVRYVLFYGITRDIIGHQSKGLEDVHARAPVFDNKVEHLWTTAQVCSAMIMSIAHGANDVSNAIGPFTTEYLVWKTGVASEETGTPTWIKAVGGLGLGVGFWTFG